MAVSVDPIIEVPIRGRKGLYTLRVHDLEEAIRPVQHVEASGAQLQFGKRSREYGQLVRRSFAEVTLYYVPRRIRNVFKGTFTETRFPATIKGPGVDWRGLVKRGRRTTPIGEAQRVEQITLTIYDGLKRLNNLPPAKNWAFLDTDGDGDDEIVESLPIHEVLSRVLTPVQQGEGYGERITVYLWFSMEIFDVQGRKWDGDTYDVEKGPRPGVGGFGEGRIEGAESKMDQLTTLLEDLGCICYVAKDQPAIEIVPREDLGGGVPAIDVHQTFDTGATVETTILSRTEEVPAPRTEENDAWEATPKGGAVTVDLGDDHNLIMDPGFYESQKREPDNGDTWRRYVPYWWNVNDDASVTAAYENNAPGNGVMLGIKEYDPVIDNGDEKIEGTKDGPGVGRVDRDVIKIGAEERPLKARLYYTADSPSYMSSGSHTFTVSHGSNSVSQSQDSYYPWDTSITVDLKDTTTTLNVELEGDNVIVYDIQLQLLVDVGGDTRTLSTIRFGNRSADPIELSSASTWWDVGPEMGSGPNEDSFFVKYGLADKVQWDGTSYLHPITLEAAMRLSQHEVGTETVETRVEGAVGPATRLTWPDGRQTIPVGRKIDLFEGRTEITDITLPPRY